MFLDRTLNPYIASQGFFCKGWVLSRITGCEYKRPLLFPGKTISFFVAIQTADVLGDMVEVWLQWSGSGLKNLRLEPCPLSRTFLLCF